MTISYNEFHISRAVRDECAFALPLYASTGNVILANMRNVRAFAVKLNEYFTKRGQNDRQVSAGSLNAMGLLDEIFHFACMMYRKTKFPDAMTGLLSDLDASFGKEKIDSLLRAFSEQFPPVAVYQGKIGIDDYLAGEALDEGTGRVRTNREATLEELMMLHLENEDPAFKPFSVLFDDIALSANPEYAETWRQMQAYFKKLPYWGAYGHDLVTFLREPVQYAPNDLYQQLEYVRTHWADLLGEWLKRLLSGLDVLNEEWKPKWQPGNGGTPDMQPFSYDNLMKEYERFSPDKEWMPKVVLMAKTVLVWLYQLSRTYGRDISRLDQIPDEELDRLRDEGFTGLWLIGLWQRSDASRKIKQICGNPEAAASAYSLNDYEIADNIGGWSALENLRTRLWQRGIRLASDMVPNHTGMDSRWVVEKPDVFVQRRDNPFPQYTFNGTNLSNDSRVSIYLEDHYYSKSDCAVVFKRVDNATGDTRYIYHGNDGTGMPWNDTAQIDFLNPAAREEVMQEILHVARNFPIIRFDAAMVLAKKHIRRLWYPEPGHGGDIATRGEYALTSDQFEAAIPQEFWREVVDRVAKEVPDTLLLAEAFWMMEGYFTRTLGMHRVYNSAFMNMLKKEENTKYRQTVQNTILFDPQVLKRFVNFMNNPDEETAVAQFGKGDKYFGVCTLMVTMPGLPMFGHGQIEGFEEKYGMEYMKAYRDEKPDGYLVDRHWHDIFPLMHKRYLFAEITDFLFYDVWDNGTVNDNVFAYSNRSGNEYAVVFYNNKYERAQGWINTSCPYAVKTGSGENDKQIVTRTIAQGLGLIGDGNHYVIFQEQRSGLWYIRNSRDIVEHGMYTSLNGFESQVFWNFRQEEDTADGQWSTLCAFLNGRGTPDIEIAWQELHYKELYTAFRAAFSRTLIDQLCALTMSAKERKASGIKKPTLKAIIEENRDSLIAFYNTALGFAEREKAGAGRAEKKSYKKLVSAEKQLSALKKMLGALIKSLPKQTAKAGKTSPAVKAAGSECFEKAQQPIFPIGAKTAQEFIASSLSVQDNAVVLLSCYAAIAKIAEAGYARKWALQRKVDEVLRENGIQARNIYNFFDRALALACYKKPAFSAKESEKAASWCVVSALVESPDAWLLTGSHTYDGIAWFNKEQMEQSLYLATLLPVLGAGKAKEEKFIKLYKKLCTAQEKAEYKCEAFAEAYRPAPKAEKTRKPKSGAASKPKNAALSKKKVHSAKNR